MSGFAKLEFVRDFESIWKSDTFFLFSAVFSMLFDPLLCDKDLVWKEHFWLSYNDQTLVNTEKIHFFALF